MKTKMIDYQKKRILWVLFWLVMELIPGFVFESANAQYWMATVAIVMVLIGVHTYLYRLENATATVEEIKIAIANNPRISVFMGSRAKPVTYGELFAQTRRIEEEDEQAASVAIQKSAVE